MMRLAALSLLLASRLFRAGEARLADAVMNHDQASASAFVEAKGGRQRGLQPDGITALHWAARWDDVDTAEPLIRAGANVKAANRFGMPPTYRLLATERQRGDG